MLAGWQLNYGTTGPRNNDEISRPALGADLCSAKLHWTALASRELHFRCSKVEGAMFALSFRFGIENAGGDPKAAG